MLSALKPIAALFNINIPKPRPWRELAVFAMIVMEISWVVPWYRALTPATNAVSTRVAFGILAGFFLFSLVTYRTVNWLKLKLEVRQGVLVTLLVLSLLVGINTLLYQQQDLAILERLGRPLDSLINIAVLIPDEFLVSLVVLVAWWRGIQLARLRVGPSEVQARFQAGFFMLILFVFINTLITGEQVGDIFYLFLFSGLLAMSAARVSVLSHLRGGQTNPFDSRWLAGMVTCALLLVALAFGLVLMVVGETHFLSNLAFGLFSIVIILGLLLLLPVAFLVLGILEAWLKNNPVGMSDFIERLANALAEITGALMGLAEKLGTFLEFLGVPIALRFLFNLRPIYYILIIGGGMLVIVLLLRLRARLVRTGVGLGEERGWLLSRGDLLKLLRKALADGLRQLGQNLSALVNANARRRQRAAERIRRIYADLMYLVEDMGRPRIPAQTPLEFLVTLDAIFPEMVTQTRVITNAYLRVRYGEIPETDEEIAEVERAWMDLQILETPNEVEP
jgi:hypothetical protein